MKLYDLGERPWRDTQLLYHALAYLGEEGIVIQRTQDPYVCLGAFGHPKSELDLDYVEENDVPIFRREIGGGTVWLDRDQVFYHAVVHEDNDLAPFDNRKFYRRFLDPVIETYDDFGLDARYVPPNDLVHDGKKISGNGGGLLDECKVVSGSILLDFDYDEMARCAAAPNEEFRRNFRDLMERNITTLNEVLGDYDEDEVKSRLIANYEDVTGPLEPGKVTDEVREEMERLDREKFTGEWLHSRGKSQNGRQLKVKEGLYQFHLELDGATVSGTRTDDAVDSVRFEVGGCRFKGLEEELEGAELREKSIKRLIANKLNNQNVEKITEAITGR